MQTMMGIDLGGTKIEIALVDAMHGVVYKDRVPTPQHSYNAILDAISALVDKTVSQQKIERPASIGIGIPGCLDPATQLVRGSNTVVMNGKPFQSICGNASDFRFICKTMPTV
jgi:fructokinase